jgi:hypothetical protein
MTSVIVLIIASHNELYHSFLELWREKIELWKAVGDGGVDYRFFFVFADPNLTEDIVCENDCITYKCEESLEPGIFLKTMAAIQYCETHFTYDFILRTNLSSFWNFSVLSSELVSETPILIGNIFMQYLNKNQLCINMRWAFFFEIIDAFFPSLADIFYFLDGAGFLLSREMIRILLIDISDLLYSKLLLIPDDVAISILLFYNILQKNTLSIEIYEIFIGNKYICYNNEIEFPMNFGGKNIGFVRNKNCDRKIDLINYKLQIDFFYKKN